LPIAIVATGTPPGICAVESSASNPFKEEESIGTPITGRAEWAATVPAKWAAPPAPAIKIATPFLSASEIYLRVQSGDRWAEVIANSCVTPNSFNTTAACSITAKSDSLPMTILTNGFRNQLTPRSGILLVMAILLVLGNIAFPSLWVKS
jgi:hypothetical protein